MATSTPEPSETATDNASATSPAPSATNSASHPGNGSTSKPSPEAASSCGPPTPTHPAPTLRTIPIANIDDNPDDHDRLALDPDALHQLADSIGRLGLINPIRVRPSHHGYRMIAGRRRLRAAQLLGWTTIPALIDQQTTNNAPAARLAENLIRADLTPVEEARAVMRLQQQTQLTPQELATHLARTTPWIRHRLALCHYPPAILEALHAAQITLAVADELAQVTDPGQRAHLLRSAITAGCNARTARLWRQHANATTTDQTTQPTQPTPPPTAGPPPRVLKDCFTCQTPTDITAMTSVFLCPNCLNRIQQALASAPPTAPTPQH